MPALGRLGISDACRAYITGPLDDAEEPGILQTVQLN
jgi:hypothetical protein